MGRETETQREKRRNGHLGPAFLQLNPSEEEAGGAQETGKQSSRGGQGRPRPHSDPPLGAAALISLSSDTDGKTKAGARWFVCGQILQDRPLTASEFSNLAESGPELLRGPSTVNAKRLFCNPVLFCQL